MLEDLSIDGEDNVKMDLKNWDWSTDWRQVACPCERGNEPPTSMEGGGVGNSEQLRIC
jgi:hypothetical protein